MKIILFTLGLVVLMTSCKKEPGEGGASSIYGKVQVYNINSFGDTLGEPFYGMDEDVYIIYGENDDTYDDKFATSFDGSFRFDYLTPGKYTLFSYSRCDVCNDELTVIKKTVEITSDKSENPISDIIILK